MILGSGIELIIEICTKIINKENPTENEQKIIKVILKSIYSSISNIHNVIIKYKNLIRSKLILMSMLVLI